MRNIFDHPIQDKEASSRLLSLSQGSSHRWTDSKAYRAFARWPDDFVAYAFFLFFFVFVFCDEI